MSCYCVNGIYVDGFDNTTYSNMFKTSTNLQRYTSHDAHCGGPKIKATNVTNTYNQENSNSSIYMTIYINDRALDHQTDTVFFE